MKVGVIRSYWITYKLSLSTAKACIKAICKNAFGTINRPWADSVITTWINELLKEVEVDYKVINPHGITLEKNTPYIIMSNHTSAYDIPLGFKSFPDSSIRMLAKKELSRIPIFGSAMKAAEFPFVDRKNRNQAIKDLAFARELMLSGIVLWISPEGTRSRNGKLQKFKKGGFITAIQAKAKIIPVGIRGAYDIIPADGKQYNLNQQVELHVGRIFDAADYSMNDKEQLVDEVYAEMQKLVGEEHI